MIGTTRRAKLNALLDQPDQEALRKDLADFFGPHSDRYLAIFEKMRSKSGYYRFVVMSWNWAVLFLAYTWFFYRKLYAVGWVLVLLPIALKLAHGGGGGGAGVYIVLAAIADSTYVQAALHRIAKANNEGRTGDDRAAYLQRSGGVSKLAGVVAGIVVGLFLALTLFSSYAAHQNKISGKTTVQLRAVAPS